MDSDIDFQDFLSNLDDTEIQVKIFIHHIE